MTWLTVDQILDPHFMRQRIIEDAAAADAYDRTTGETQLDRDTEFLQTTIRRRDMTLDLMVGSWMAEDKRLFEDQLARLDALIAREQERLGL